MKTKILCGKNTMATAGCQEMARKKLLALMKLSLLEEKIFLRFVFFLIFFNKWLGFLSPTFVKILFERK